MAHYCPTYCATTVTIMDMSPWIAQIRCCCLVHQHITGLIPMIDVQGHLLDAIVTADAHIMITGTDLDSVAPNLAPVTTAVEVVAARTPIEVTPDHSTDLTIAASHMTGALVPTTAAVTHLTADLHLIGIPPKMTADLDIHPGNNTTDQPEDLHHKNHLGNTRIRDTNKSQLDDPPSEYYSSDDNNSHSDDDLN